MMNGISRRRSERLFSRSAGRRRWTLAMAAVAVLAACGEQPPAGAPGGLRFALADGGLPRYGMWKTTPLLADFNGDGLLDLAANSRLTDDVRVWLGDGQGGWRDASAGLAQAHQRCGGALATGDVNRDGKPDLVVADHCGGVSVFLGDGAGGWELVVENLNPTISDRPDLSEEERNYYTGAEGVAVGDVNEDGFPDIVASASDIGGFTVYLGDGTGRGWRQTAQDGLPSWDDPELDDGKGGGWATQVLLRDMDGDGHLDVVASYYAGPRVWRGDGQGQWQRSWQGLPEPTVGGLFWRIAVADVNEDGRLDLVVANQVNGPEVFIQNADGSWRQLPDMMPDLKGGAEAVGFADLDGDGHVDLVVGGRQNRKDRIYRLYALRGDGKGGFALTEAGLPQDLQWIWGITPGDVDNNGRPDIVAATGSTTKQKGSKQPWGFGKEPVPVPKDKQEETDTQPRLQVWLNQG